MTYEVFSLVMLEKTLRMLGSSVPIRVLYFSLDM